MNKDQIKNVLDRLQQLSAIEQESCIWRMFGGIESRCQHTPHAPIDDAFRILETHVTTAELKRPAA